MLGDRVWHWSACGEQLCHASLVFLGFVTSLFLLLPSFSLHDGDDDEEEEEEEEEKDFFFSFIKLGS